MWSLLFIENEMINAPVHFPEMLPWAETTEASAKARITELENMMRDGKERISR
jgi:hypothetical protein